MFTLLFSILAVGVFAQTKEDRGKSISVPAAVKQAFEKQFPNATPKWEREGADYEANFNFKGQEMSANFNGEGRISETEQEITAKELPTEILNYLEKNFKDEKITGAAKITKPDGIINYEAEVRHKDLMFDEAGKLLSK